MLWVWAVILLPNQFMAWQSWNCRGQKRRACSFLALESHKVRSHCSAPEREHLHILSVADKWVNPIVSGIYQLRTARLSCLVLTNATLKKTAKRKWKTDTFSLWSPCKTRVGWKSLYHLWHSPVWAAHRARGALGTAPCLETAQIACSWTEEAMSHPQSNDNHI